MCTNVLALHIFIDFSHDGLTLRWNPGQILRATTTPDFEQGWWSVCVRTVWVAGCGMARKRSARWTLWPCTRTMVSSGSTRSTCLFKLPHARADQSSFISNCIWLNHIFNFGIVIDLPTYQSASCIICTGCLTGENPPNSTVLSCHLCLFYWPPKSPNNIGILIIQMQNQLVWTVHGEWDNLKLFVVFHFTQDVI